MRAGCKLKNIPECRSELVNERGKAGRVSIILKNRIFRQFYQKGLLGINVLCFAPTNHLLISFAFHFNFSNKRSKPSVSLNKSIIAKILIDCFVLCFARQGPIFLSILLDPLWTTGDPPFFLIISSFFSLNAPRHREISSHSLPTNSKTLVSYHLLSKLGKTKWNTHTRALTQCWSPAWLKIAK